jgi:replicative DNA helicase
MKITQREIELKILKCAVSVDGAIDICSEKKLEEYHFQTKEPGTDTSFLAKIYILALNYSKSTGGYKLTETVLESLLVKKNVKESTRQKFLSVWYEIQSEDTTVDELPYLISLLKDRYCLSLFKELVDKNTNYAQNDQVKDMISSMVDYANLMSEEQEEFSKDKEQFDMTEAHEFFIDEYEKRLEDPDQFKGINIGLSNIDSKTFGFFPSQLIVLLAPSSGGKSVQMLNWAVYAHQVCKKKVMYFSFEMSSRLCKLRHASLISEINFEKFKGDSLTEDDKNELISKFCEIKDGPYFEYFVSTEDPTPEFVEQKIRELASTKGMPEFIVVDYIGNMTTRATSKSAKPWERNGDAAEGLFKITKRYNVTVLTAQQINRESIRENRKNKESGKSSAYYQDAASGDQRLMHLAYYVIGMEPNREENICWYHPVKMRDAYFKPFAAKWIPEYNKVVELTDSQQSALEIIQSSNPYESDNLIKKPKNNVIEEFYGGGFSVEFPA